MPCPGFGVTRDLNRDLGYYNVFYELAQRSFTGIEDFCEWAIGTTKIMDKKGSYLFASWNEMLGIREKLAWDA